jgi:ribonuclease T2
MTAHRLLAAGCLALTALASGASPSLAQVLARVSPPPTTPAPTAVLERIQFAPSPRYQQENHGSRASEFDYYALAMSWSPTHCATTDRPDEQQCNRRDGRRFAFVLHGLWPQHERGYPEFCPTRDRPFVPQRTIEAMMDVMPSRGLIIHQYRKHGVCSGLEPDRYFDLSRNLFTKVKIPQRFVSPEQQQMVDTSTIVQEFVAANPGLRPDMLAVVCGGSGNRLREIRVCFTKEGTFRTCGTNENQRRLCAAPRVFVPPVRESASPSGRRFN